MDDQIDRLVRLIPGCEKQRLYKKFTQIFYFSDVRRAITDMECSNKENDDNSEIQASMNTMIQQCNNMYEAQFLLEQLLQYAISKAAEAAQRSTKMQALEARVVESEQENAVNERYISELVNSARRVHPDSLNHTYILANDTPKRESKCWILSLFFLFVKLD